MQAMEGVPLQEHQQACSLVDTLTFSIWINSKQIHCEGENSQTPKSCSRSNKSSRPSLVLQTPIKIKIAPNHCLRIFDHTITSNSSPQLAAISKTRMANAT